MGLHDRLSRQGDGAATLAVIGNGAAHASPTSFADDPYAELKSRIHHQCIAKLGPELFKQDGSSDLTDQVYRAVTEELALDRTPLTRDERREIVRQLTDDILGYGPIEPLLRDDSVTEVMVNGFDKVYVERNGKLERSDVRFVDDSHVMRIIDKIVSQIGRRVDEASPMVDARLPDGSRVNIIIPPLAIDGASVSIRKFSKKSITLDIMAANLSMSPAMATMLKIAARCRLNILISGGTGSGKTTLLNALSRMIDSTERTVTIEDAAELQLQQPHVVRLETRTANLEGTGEINMRDLLKNALSNYKRQSDRRIAFKFAISFETPQGQPGGYLISLWRVWRLRCQLYFFFSMRSVTVFLLRTVK